ncbi:hypothetical protein KNP414_04429 [Paenibacillus mucilaginosus KNP414]|nr:hypothetical protein KNP414_04429 [Paenibacillus mucilaginosus KNP414]
MVYYWVIITFIAFILFRVFSLFSKTKWKTDLMFAILIGCAAAQVNKRSLLSYDPYD